MLLCICQIVDNINIASVDRGELGFIHNNITGLEHQVHELLEYHNIYILALHVTGCGVCSCVNRLQ